MAAKKKKTKAKSSKKIKKANRTATKKAPMAKSKKTARKKAAKKTTKRKVAGKALSPKLKTPRKAPARRGGLAGLNYRTLEAEIARLTDLLQALTKKSDLVRKSLNYLEKEQKRLHKQIQEARKYLAQLKNWGVRALRDFPENAEDILSQLRTEFNRIYARLGFRRKP